MRMPHVPPVVLAAAAWAAQRPLTQGRAATGPSRAAAVGTAAVSIAFAGSAIKEFLRRKTTLNPMTPGGTTLVTSGANAISRNPMYVGLAGLLVAHAVGRRSVAALGPVAVFILAIDRLQIRPEEAALRERFGADYEEYVRTVPRWLGPRP